MKKHDLFEVIIGLLAVVSIILLTINYFVDISTRWLFILYCIDLVICLIFAAEFVYRIRMAENKKFFLKSNGYEILAMVPAFVFYAAGSIAAISAALRLLRLIRVVRVIAVFSRMKRLYRIEGSFIHRSRLLYLLTVTVVLVVISSATIFFLEKDAPGAQINNFSDALWWSISTVSTVGYGDIVPNGVIGRIIGMILMVIGIGIMTALISQISATLVQSRLEKNKASSKLKNSMISEIKRSLDNIENLTDHEIDLLTNMMKLLRSEKTG
ncbi:MAG: potassium channel family protein [Dehalococcoidia bacterium]